MKSLQTIQKLSKLGRVLCRIAFIVCVVSFCFCAAGIVSLALGAGTLSFGGVTLIGIIETKAELNVGTLYASMAEAMIICAGETVLAKFAEHYFAGELEDGTPFDVKRADELRRLGILTICIPLGTQIVAEIVHEALAHIWIGVETMKLDNAGSVMLGVMFIVLSVIFRYGAECSENEGRIL